MRKSVRLGLSFLALAALGALAGPFVLDAETLRRALIDQLSTALGRPVTIERLQIKFLPTPSVRLATVKTAFADTAHYLYDHLQQWARDELGIHAAVVVGGTGRNAATLGRTDFNNILTNFAPRAKRRDQIPGMPAEEIDLLIGTDCISEGQNLQDCDTVVNYDIHWNPVRIIQRFGRIDRIGSLNHAVALINFWPTPDLNEYLNLRSRVEARMALVDEIGEYKRENNVTIYQVQRWKEILRTRMEWALALGLDEDFIRALLHSLHKESISRQTGIMNREVSGKGRE